MQIDQICPHGVSDLQEKFHDIRDFFRECEEHRARDRDGRLGELLSNLR